MIWCPIRSNKTNHKPDTNWMNGIRGIMREMGLTEEDSRDRES
jgi:hypothetical protein